MSDRADELRKWLISGLQNLGRNPFSEMVPQDSQFRRLSELFSQAASMPGVMPIGSFGPENPKAVEEMLMSVFSRKPGYVTKQPRTYELLHDPMPSEQGPYAEFFREIRKGREKYDALAEKPPQFFGGYKEDFSRALERLQTSFPELKWKQTPKGTLYTPNNDFSIEILPNERYLVMARKFGGQFASFPTMDEAVQWIARGLKNFRQK